jgi:hypothetical protein
MLESTRFKLTDTILYQGHVTKSSWRKPEILRREVRTEDYTTFTVTNDLEFRPDKISNIAYKTPHLDWLIIAYNQAPEPFAWPRTGEIIKIPKSELFMPELLV